ncbi:hypothetical protein MYG64_04875 [Ensifer adhaerens]|uniref:hypothetical protein n=1 Tax=Ensifer adhaerens TaxID=106592 RepID=UPI00210173BF|nr:hypothetical protein [Ensifer adhaerens]UTV37653.1 hypothetical protein MYG64_04875 [Ensifer adhaerens]
MPTWGAITLIAGVLWLDRRALAEWLIRILKPKRGLPADQIAAQGQFLDWIAALPAWPGAAMIVVSGIVMFLM